MKRSLIIVNESQAMAAFAKLGYNSKGDETASEWARRAYENGAFPELPGGQKADRPHNKALLDIIKSRLQARDLPFDWSPARSKTHFKNYPMTDTHRQLSIIELAILTVKAIDVFETAAKDRTSSASKVMPSHGAALEASAGNGVAQIA